jgi:ABC-type Fe3+ transport system substrate-binding protein
MAQRKQQQKDVLQRLADSGEEALQKFIADLPGGSKVVGAANSLFARVDELTKRVRSLDPLERRVAELEKRLDALTKPKAKPAAKRTTAARKTSASRTRKPAA